ncbi:MAG: hypothetical protein ACREOQ_19420 [Gemmatimonadales bacterium]
MTTTRDLPVENLLLDSQNPRLPEGLTDQRSVLEAMWAAEGEKTLELAGDIVQNRLSPAERLMALPHPEEAKRFIVLEGNRRLTALRILRNPDLVDGLLTGPARKRLDGWAQQFAKEPITKVECVIFDTRAEANDWIEKRHSTDQGGASLVGWGTIEKARFAFRQHGKKSPELEVLDYVEAYGDLDEATRAKLPHFNLTNLQRLVDDHKVRKRLGIAVTDAGVARTRPADEVRRALSRVVREIAGGLKVDQIYREPDRQGWLDTIKGDLPAKSSGKQAAVLLGEDAEPAPAVLVPLPVTARVRVPSTGPRRTLADRACKLNIPTAKTRKIFGELKDLELDATPNAAAVLFRVFVELTVDHYIKVERVAVGGKGLALRLKACGKHLHTAKRLSENAHKAVVAAANSTKSNPLNNDVVTFQQWVHNEHLQPTASDLRASWDNLQPFFEAVWS